MQLPKSLGMGYALSPSLRDLPQRSYDGLPSGIAVGRVVEGLAAARAAQHASC